MQIIEHTEGRVPGPGLYRMPAALYHADPAPEPSLSSSIAKIVVEQSPEHAFFAHPRLGRPDEECDPTRPKEIGTAVHKIILGQGRDLVVVEVDDWKKADARTRRVGAYDAGLSPILRPDLDKAEAMADRALIRLVDVPDCHGFRDAPSELVAIVRHKSGAWLRVMLDRFERRGNRAIIWDVKSGEQSAAPHTLGRRLENMAMEIQAAFYVHVVECLVPELAGRVTFRWLFVENDEPHAITVAEADSAALDIGARKVAAAVHRWNHCLAAGKWPSYSSEIIRAEYPDWAERRWSEREERDPHLAGIDWSLATSPFRPLDRGEAA